MVSRPIQAALGVIFCLLALRAPAQHWPAVVVEWAPDGKVLMASNGLLARFDLESDDEELLDDTGVTFALGPGGTRLAVGGHNRLELRGYPDLKLQRTFELAEPADIYSLAWTPDGATLAAGTREGHILLWDMERGEQWADLGIEPASGVSRLAFSADGVRLLSAYEGGRALLWDIERREVLHRFEPPRSPESGPETETIVAALSPDGRYVLSTRLRGGDSELVLLRDDGRIAWRRAGYGVDFTPDSKALLALTPPFRIAVLYSAADAEALRVFEPPEAVETLYLVRPSPDGTKVLGVGEDYAGQVLIVWDFATARVLKTRR